MSKDDGNQIIKGLECHPKEPECILRADLAARCGTIGRRHVSKAQVYHLLAVGLREGCRLSSLETPRQSLECKMESMPMGGRGRKQGWPEEGVKEPPHRVPGKLWREDGLSQLSCFRLKWPGLHPHHAQSPDAQAGHGL